MMRLEKVPLELGGRGVIFNFPEPRDNARDRLSNFQLFIYA